MYISNHEEREKMYTSNHEEGGMGVLYMTHE